MRKERRHSPRIKPEGLLYLKLGPENGGIILDLCEGGLCFRVVAPVEAGEPLTFSLSLAPAKRFRATGELAWTDQSRKTGGLHFTSLPATARHQLKAWLEQHGLAALQIAAMEELEISTDAPATEFAEETISPVEEMQSASAEPANEARNADSVVELSAPPQSQSAVDVASAMHAPPAPDPEVSPPAPASEEVPAPRTLAVALGLTSGQAPARQAAPDSRNAQESAAGFSQPPREPQTAAARIATRAWKFARDLVLKSKELAASVISSEDVQNAPEHFVLTAVEFTVIAASVGFGFFRTLATPGVVREATKFAALIAAVALLVAFILGFHGDLGNSLVNLGRDIAGEQQAAPAAPAPTAPETAPAPSSAGESPAPKRPREERSSSSAPRKPVSHPALPVPGGSDLDIARQYLRGGPGTRQPEKAIPWLWAAAHEGNAAAEILLADLYIRGDGAPQNCEQGIVLLTAAAKKGDPVAASKLAGIDSGPCGTVPKRK